jgi:hypothetical protein
VVTILRAIWFLIATLKATASRLWIRASARISRSLKPAGRSVAHDPTMPPWWGSSGVAPPKATR